MADGADTEVWNQWKGLESDSRRHAPLAMSATRVEVGSQNSIISRKSRS